MKIDSILLSSINNGEILKIKYHGGSQPGTLRNIAPIQLKENKVIARCYSSNKVKTFLLSKIEVVEMSVKGEKWTIGKEEEIQYKSLLELFNEIQFLLSDLGWHIEKHFVGESQYISLHKYFKNGNPKKVHEIIITYDKYITESVLDLDSDDEVLESEIIITGKRLRPWTTSSIFNTHRSYSKLDKAANLFIEYAKTYSTK